MYALTFLLVMIIKVNCIDWFSLGNLTFNFGDEFLNGCIIIMKPANVTIDEAAGLQYLAANLARADRTRFEYQLQVGMYSYETIIKHSNDRLDERSCYNSLHVIIMSEYTNNQLISLFESKSMKHSMWLLYAESFENIKTLEILKFNIDSKIYVATKVSETFIDIYEVYRVTKNFPMRIKKIGRWNETATHKLSVKRIQKYLSRGNLEMFQFRAGSVENWPISSFYKGEAGKTMEIDGMFPRVWFELGNLLNFTTKCFPSTDETSGKQSSDGTWTGLVGMLLRNEIDVILSEFSMSLERLPVTESLLPLLTDSLEIYYVPEGIPWDWFAILKPLGTSIWLALLAWLIIAAISLRISSTLAMSHGLPVADHELPSPCQNVFFVLQSICQQGASYIPQVSSTRIIFITCYLVSAVLIPCYSASLISSLARRDPQTPFDSFEDLVKANIPIYTGASYEMEFFENSKDIWVQKAYKALVRTTPLMSELEGNELAYKIMCTEPVAMFGAYSTVDRTVEKFPDCYPTTFSKPIMKIYQVIGLRKESQFREIINCNILRMNEFGLINRFKIQFSSKNHNEDGLPLVEAVDMYDVFEIFIILTIAMIISIIILTFEIFYSRYLLRSCAHKQVKHF